MENKSPIPESRCINPSSSSSVSVFEFALYTLVLVIIIYGVFVFVKGEIGDEKRMDKFCQDEGYEGYTDWGFGPLGEKRVVLKVECDSGPVFAVEIELDCSSTDKWGNCNKAEKFLRKLGPDVGALWDI